MKATKQIGKHSFSICIPDSPSDGEVVFVKQLGVGYVYTWAQEE